MTNELPRSYDRRQGTGATLGGSSISSITPAYGLASPVAYTGSTSGYWHPEQKKPGTSFTLGSKSLFWFLVVASVLLFVVCVVLLVLFIINLTKTTSAVASCTTSSTTLGPTASPGQCNKVDLMLIVDNSQYLSAADFTTIKSFLSNKFVPQFVISKTQVQLSCLVYAKFQLSIFNLDGVDSLNKAQQMINRISQSAETPPVLNMAKPLLAEQKPRGDRADARNVIVLFASNTPADYTTARTAAGTLRSQGTAIYTVSVGINGPDLVAISDGHFVVRHIEQLNDVATELHKAICTN